MNPEKVIEFWFADSTTDPLKARERFAFWFQPSPQTDAAIRERFSDLVCQAQAEALGSWETEPRCCLALIITLDQFPRNLHRGKPQAFAADPLALEVVRRGLSQSYLSALSPIEQAFFLMPLQHAEHLSVQEESVRWFESLVSQVPAEWREALGAYLGSARKHYSIIERFGRFPHRNPILGRESTAAEQEFLASGSGSFGQLPVPDQGLGR